MNLTDIISNVMEDHSKRKTNPEMWEQIKKKLGKNGYGGRETEEAMREINLIGADIFLKVWETLDKYGNRSKYKWGGRDQYRKQNIKIIKELCKIDDIEKIIEILNEIGYDIFSTYNGNEYIYLYLSDEMLQTFKELAENNLYKKYSLNFKALKKLGYKNIKSYDTNASIQLNHFMEINKTDGDTAGVIYTLAVNGYQIDQVIGLSEIDIRNIEQIIEKAQTEKSDGKGGIPVYLYDTGNLEIFQEYFNSLETEKKKSVLRSILEYETKEDSKDPLLKEPKNQIQEWLEKDYEFLISEVGFED